MIGEEGQTILNLVETLKLRHLQSIVELVAMNVWAYLIFVIFFTQAKFLENKIYTEIYTVNCQFTQ